MYERRFKRGADLAVCSVLLTLTAPILLVAAILIWLEDRQSPIFRQQRIGRAEQEFTILKLRTMTSGASNIASAEAGELQVTSAGALFRRTNIDELPQLVNILRGDMSLVGPRPALAAQSELIERRRAGGAYRVKPGLTGLAQVRAYDGMPESEKAGHDIEYAENVSFRADVAILLKTFAYLRKPPPRY